MGHACELQGAHLHLAAIKDSKVLHSCEDYPNILNAGVSGYQVPCLLVGPRCNVACLDHTNFVSGAGSQASGL